MRRREIGILLGLALIVGCVGQDSDPTATASSTPGSSSTTPATSSTTVAATAPSGSSTTHPAGSTTIDTSPMNVLVFHKTAGFRHQSIEAGIEALELLGSDSGFEITATEDSSIFSDQSLDAFRVIVFLNTTGDVLVESEESAMEEFVRSGGGFVGVHAAADTEYEWEWYGGLVGAYFDGHPHPQAAVVEVAQPDAHPVVQGLSGRVERFDEWYNFRSHPGPEVTVLATLDESTYDGGTMGASHPIAWAHEYDGGRAVYIGFGHTSETFDEPLIRTLLDNAVHWAAGQTG